MIHHAYDVELDPERIAIVVRHAEDATRMLPAIANQFFQTVQAELFGN